MLRSLGHADALITTGRGVYQIETIGLVLSNQSHFRFVDHSVHLEFDDLELVPSPEDRINPSDATAVVSKASRPGDVPSQPRGKWPRSLPNVTNTAILTRSQAVNRNSLQLIGCQMSVSMCCPVT